MPPLPPAANVVKIGFSGTVNSVPWMVSLHGQYTGASPDTTSLNAACSAWATGWNNAFNMLYSSASILRTVEAWDLTSAAGAYGSANVNHPGTIAGNNLTNQASLCLTWKVNYRWRGGHPRSYLPPPSASETQLGRTWTTNFQTLAQTQARAFLSAFNSGTYGGLTYKLVALRYIEQGAVLPTPRVLQIADALVHSRVDSQRRRLGKEII